MRVLPLLAVLALPTPAVADNYVELFGGIIMPVDDEPWTDYVDSGPKLGLRLGALDTSGFGGMLSVDWTPLNADDWSGFGASVDVAAQRFRILVGGSVQRPIGNSLTASFRFGAGLDITHVNVETNFFGVRSKESDTDSGLALEFGGGLWFNVGSVQVGGEVGLPMSFHSDDRDDDIDLNDYRSIDIDLLFGVRFLSR
jgi:hypothetical protein